MSGRRPTRCCAFRNRTPIGLSTVPASLRVVKQMFFSMMIDGYIEEKSRAIRSEEHTSEPQSRLHVVCRLLLQKIESHMTGTINQIAIYYSSQFSPLTGG